jgi:hypothetical protein
MKTFFIVLLLVCVAPMLSGCGFFGIGQKNYNGSEAMEEAHPEYNNPPSYMQSDPQPLGN